MWPFTPVNWIHHHLFRLLSGITQSWGQLSGPKAFQDKYIVSLFISPANEKIKAFYNEAEMCEWKDRIKRFAPTVSS